MRRRGDDEAVRRQVLREIALEVGTAAAAVREHDDREGAALQWRRVRDLALARIALGGIPDVGGQHARRSIGGRRALEVDAHEADRVWPARCRVEQRRLRRHRFLARAGAAGGDERDDSDE